MEGKLTRPRIHKVGYQMWAVDIPTVDPEAKSAWWGDGETHEDALKLLREYYDYLERT